eukprot:TRINITY_DN9330_c0_g1_i2.p1 TRINITY_DN9330_c0_g1~~TRINITY_DN9330_c0_g1_i2.p1  ORF type:complete len:576 (-),score=118.29 TRINITY_DN9330_c0_g1_i2:329-2056(-)
MTASGESRQDADSDCEMAASAEQQGEESTTISGAAAPKPITPIPKREMFVLMCIVIAEGFAFTMVLPFVAFLVIDFGYSEEDVGYYAGFITSCFFAAQLVSSFFWGWLSDVKGRRLVLLIGLAGNAISNIWFGFSSNLYIAVVSRSFAGLLNGISGVSKSYLRDITDETNQSKCYIYRSTGYAIGMAAGPLLGGLLARPIEQYPSVFSKGTFFDAWPYFLPCFVSGLINVVGLATGFVFLRETRNSSFAAPMVDSNADAARRDADSLTADDTPAHDSADERGRLNPGTQSRSVASYWRRLLSKLRPGGRARSYAHLDEDRTTELQSDESIELDLSQSDGTVTRDGRTTQKDSAPEKEGFLARLKGVGKFGWLSIGLYTSISFAWLAFDEVFAIWSLRPPDEGGIHFTPADIGIVQAFSSITMLVMQVAAYVPMDRKFGSRNVFTAGMLAWLVSMLAMPFTNLLTSYTPALWVCVCLAYGVKTGFGSCAMAAVTLLINNTVSAEVTGFVNGLAVSCAAASRLVAPPLAGSLFALTANSSLPFPLDFHFVFILVALVSLGSAIVANRLPTSVNFRRS